MTGSLISAEVDYEAPGKQSGYLRVPHSVHRSAYGWLPVPMAVGLYITAAYWFTSSTSFANPAVTIARGFSDTFAGIAPGDVAAFIGIQLVAAVLASGFFHWLLKEDADA